MKNFFNKLDVQDFNKFYRYSTYAWGRSTRKFVRIIYFFKLRLSKSKMFLKIIFEIINLKNFDDIYNTSKYPHLFVYNTSDYKNPEYWYRRYYGDSKKGLSIHLFIQEFSNVNIIFFNPSEGFSSEKKICLGFLRKNIYLLFFFLPLIPFSPKLYDFIIYKLNLSVFSQIIKKLAPKKIIFPFEGQTWEYALIRASSKKKIGTLGFVHALNITTEINTRIKFFKGISSNSLITANILQTKYLIEKKSWPANKIKTFSLYRESPLEILFKNSDQIKSDYILFLGSYFKHEDDFAISLINYHKKIFKSTKILYKPHPLNIKKIKLNKSFKNLRIIYNLDQLNHTFPSSIISPLSSTASLEILSYSSIPVLIYKSKNYICPNPFEQFKIDPIIIDEDNININNLFNKGPLHFLNNSSNLNYLNFENKDLFL